MYRRKPLALRIKRYLVLAGAIRQQGHRLGGELNYRYFHRIAKPALSGATSGVFQIVAVCRHLKKAAMRLDQ